MAGVKAGCVHLWRWHITLCDPVRQVTPCSCEISINSFTFYLLSPPTLKSVVPPTQKSKLVSPKSAVNLAALYTIKCQTIIKVVSGVLNTPYIYSDLYFCFTFWASCIETCFRLPFSVQRENAVLTMLMTMSLLMPPAFLISARSAWPPAFHVI